MLYYPPHNSLILFGGILSLKGIYEYHIRNNSWTVANCNNNLPSNKEAFVMQRVFAYIFLLYFYRKEKMKFSYLAA